MRERSLRDVPRPVLLLLALALGAQVLWHARVAPRAADALALAPPPSLAWLRVASLGEPVALSKLLMFHVQTADSEPGQHGAYSLLDYRILQDWLDRIADLDPQADYPLIAASHLYAEVHDLPKKRMMLEFIYRRFLRDPNRHWRALAHATQIAKHKLHDLPLARRYASAIRLHATGPQVPGWARQMELFVLEDMNEIDSARILLGGLIASGQAGDARERAFLQQRLTQMIEKKAAP